MNDPGDPKKTSEKRDRHAVPRTAQYERVLSENSPLPIPRKKTRPDGTPERARAVWVEFYSRQGGGNPNPFFLELSGRIAGLELPPTAVQKLEAALELEPGELLSGTLPIMWAEMTSTKADVMIFHPRRCRYVEAIVDILERADINAIAEAFKLLGAWSPLTKTDGGGK